MVKCKRCSQEMLDPSTVDCIENITVDFPDGMQFTPSRFHFDEPSGRCHDCNIVHGGRHHLDCDVERCPRCGGQLITCGCLYGEYR